jgi:hypothetical protein
VHELVLGFFEVSVLSPPEPADDVVDRGSCFPFPLGLVVVAEAARAAGAESETVLLVAGDGTAKAGSADPTESLFERIHFESLQVQLTQRAHSAGGSS